MKLSDLGRNLPYLAHQREAFRLLCFVIERFNIEPIPSGGQRAYAELDLTLSDRLHLWAASLSTSCPTTQSLSNVVDFATTLLNARNYLPHQREACEILAEIVAAGDLKLKSDATVTMVLDQADGLIERMAVWGAGIECCEDHDTDDEDGADCEPDERDLPKLGNDEPEQLVA